MMEELKTMLKIQKQMAQILVWEGEFWENVSLFDYVATLDWAQWNAEEGVLRRFP